MSEIRGTISQTPSVTARRPPATDIENLRAAALVYRTAVIAADVFRFAAAYNNVLKIYMYKFTRFIKTL